MSAIVSSLILLLVLAASSPPSQAYDPTAQAAWILHASQSKNLNPLDRPDDVQQAQKDIAARVVLSEKNGTLWAKLVKVQIDIRMDTMDVDPVGKDALEKVLIEIPWGETETAAKPVPGGDMDATQWPAIEPMAEFLAQLLQLSLPPLPAVKIQAGNFWSKTGKIETALEGAPGVSTRVYIFSTTGDLQPCPGGTCIELSQIIHISSFQRRPMGNSILGIDLDGSGLVTTKLRVQDRSLVSSSGWLNMESDTISHLSLGLPPTYAMHTSSQTSFELNPLEEYKRR